MRRRSRCLAVLACALSLSGCTLVSTSSSPNVVGSSNVPLGLLSPTIPFTVDQQVHWVTRSVYLVNAQGALVAVGRLMTAPPTLTDVLHYLLGGPNATEQSFGITSALPSTMSLNLATPDGRVAKVDVSSVLRQLSPLEQRVAVAQMLFTVAAIGYTRGIEISTNQTPFALTLANGKKVSLVTPADLSALK